MSSYTSRLLLGSALLAALAVAISLVASLGDRAHAQIDITGDWGIMLVVDLPDFHATANCLAWVVQEGGSLSTAMTCDGAGGGGRLSGTIDDGGALALSGNVASLSLALSGTVSGDGGSMNGIWSTGGDASGSFSGYRIGSLWGDADCNGDVTIVDALRVLQFEARLPEIPQCYEFADVNVDGGVNSVDALLIQQLEAGLIDRLPTL